MTKEGGPMVSSGRQEKVVIYKRKIDFFQKAVTEGAHLRPPLARHMSMEQWEKRVNIGLVYNFNEDVSMKEMGEAFCNITRKRISQINRKFTEDMWHNSSSKLKQRYPLQELFVKKPLSQVKREKMSIANGGTTFKIKEQLKNGVADIIEIAKATGIPKQKILSRRGILRSWDNELPGKYRIAYEKMRGRVDGENSYRRLQGIMNSLSIGSLRGFTKSCCGKRAIFASFSGISSELKIGYSDYRAIVKLLRQKHIPVRVASREQVNSGKKKKVRYYFIYVKHEQQIKDILAEDSAGRGA